MHLFFVVQRNPGIRSESHIIFQVHQARRYNFKRWLRWRWDLDFESERWLKQHNIIRYKIREKHEISTDDPIERNYPQCRNQICAEERGHGEETTFDHERNPNPCLRHKRFSRMFFCLLKRNSWWIDDDFSGEKFVNCTSYTEVTIQVDCKVIFHREHPLCWCSFGCVL